MNQRSWERDDDHTTIIIMIDYEVFFSKSDIPSLLLLSPMLKISLQSFRTQI